MNERRNAALVLAMCSLVKKRISKIEDAAKAVADVSFPDEKTAAVIGDTVVGYTSRVSRRPAEPFAVLDEGKFVEWVAARWPTEVEMRVRPAFLTELANRAERTGGVLVDEQGEVCEAVKLADPIVYTMTRLQKEADAVLEPLLADQSLSSLPDYIEYADAPQELDGSHDE